MPAISKPVKPCAVSVAPIVDPVPIAVPIPDFMPSAIAVPVFEPDISVLYLPPSLYILTMLLFPLLLHYFVVEFLLYIVVFVGFHYFQSYSLPYLLNPQLNYPFLFLVALLEQIELYFYFIDVL